MGALRSPIDDLYPLWRGYGGTSFPIDDLYPLWRRTPMKNRVSPIFIFNFLVSWSCGVSYHEFVSVYLSSQRECAPQEGVDSCG